MELETVNQGIGVLDLPHWSRTHAQDASGHGDLPILGIDGGI
jgi:hypothetical protein